MVQELVDRRVEERLSQFQDQIKDQEELIKNLKDSKEKRV